MTDTGDSPATMPPDLGDAWATDLEERSTKERVYEVATTLTEPTRVADVADRAECSKGGARTNLEWLAELGVLERVADDPAMYRRNEAYFDFRRVYHLTRDHDAAELEALIEDYDDREAELAAEFDAESPAEVDVLTTVAFDELDEAYDRLSEWRTVRRRLRELRRARLMLQREHAEGEDLSAA
jgi:predicted ArsR family transcriptional regulator